MGKGAQRGQEHDLDFHLMMNKAKRKSSSKSHHPAHGTKRFSSPDWWMICSHRNFRWDGRRKLFAGVLSRVHKSGFISPTPVPVAQPDVLSSLCCKMLSN